MKILKHFKRYKLFSNLKLQQKLLLSYFLLIFLPLGIFMYFTYGRVYTAVESILKFSAQQSFEQTAMVISKKVEYATNVSNTILMSKPMNSFVTNNLAEMDVFGQMGEYIELNKLFDSYINSNDIYKVRLYVKDTLVYNNNDSFLSLTKAKKAAWFSQLIGNSKNTLWEYFPKDVDINPEFPTISLLRFIRDQNDYLKQVAVLRVDISQSEIQTILKKSKSTRSSLSYIQNSENIIYSTSVDSIATNWKPDFALLPSLEKNDGFFFGTYKQDGHQFLLGCQRISNTDLQLVTVIPYNEILDVSKKIRDGMLVLLMILSAVAYFFAYIISTSIVRRIKLLIENISKIQTGEFGTKITITSHDEIGELMDNFNYMSAKLSELAKEQYRIGRESKGYELKALQGQINPHFLYNTLDLINWTAINNNVPEISTLVKALSKFYKLSLSKGADIISIKDELEHVQIFTDIQNMRFDNAFHLFLDIDERVYEYSTIKIILQPLVENSILHGILKKEVKTGTITIIAVLEDEKIFITIHDDGGGMTEDEIEGILFSPATAHGYGVRNINERIKLYYGNAYGLSYNSVLNGGTTVNIIIPAVK